MDTTTMKVTSKIELKSRPGGRNRVSKGLKNLFTKPRKSQKVADGDPDADPEESRKETTRTTISILSTKSLLSCHHTELKDLEPTCLDLMMTFQEGRARKNCPYPEPANEELIFLRIRLTLEKYGPGEKPPPDPWTALETPANIRFRREMGDFLLDLEARSTEPKLKWRKVKQKIEELGRETDGYLLKGTDFNCLWIEVKRTGIQLLRYADDSAMLGEKFITWADRKSGSNSTCARLSLSCQSTMMPAFKDWDLKFLKKEMERMLANGEIQRGHLE